MPAPKILFINKINLVFLDKQQSLSKDLPRIWINHFDRKKKISYSRPLLTSKWGRSPPRYENNNPSDDPQGRSIAVARRCTSPRKRKHERIFPRFSLPTNQAEGGGGYGGEVATWPTGARLPWRREWAVTRGTVEWEEPDELRPSPRICRPERRRHLVALRGTYVVRKFDDGWCYDRVVLNICVKVLSITAYEYIKFG